jgi:Fur family ferric uptake transcriptional regulator
MKDLFRKFKNILGSHNYKMTSQRRDILEVLIENQHNHFSADKLLSKVREINSDIGLATIYRNLELFCKLGITIQMDFDSSYKYYELNLDENHHHHLICIRCGKIIEFNDQALEKFENELESEYNFSIMNHRIKFHGLCQECDN